MVQGGAVAVFVKTPGLSPVKTRLAKALGAAQAEAFHLASAQAVSAVIQSAARRAALQGYFAVAEQAGLTAGHWQSLPCVWQGEGGLGERMAHVYATLLQQYAFVILVGADSPQMAASYLTNAGLWLSDSTQARFSFGASVDGGFWLLGGNSDVPLANWTEVIYSQADTGAQCLGKIRLLGDVQMLPRLHDVDEAADLLPVKTALQALHAPVPEQIELVRLLGAMPCADFYDATVAIPPCIT